MHPTSISRRQAALMLSAAALGSTGGLGARTGAAHARTAPASSAAPDFTLRTLGGPNLRLAEQQGSVVLVNFWATWCAPCREEMPHLNRMYEKYRASGFTLLGVNVDDDVRNAARVSQSLALRFPVLLDSDKSVVKLYAVTTMPSTMLIDREGRLRSTHKGYKAGVEETYEQLVRGLLKE